MVHPNVQAMTLQLHQTLYTCMQCDSFLRAPGRVELVRGQPKARGDNSVGRQVGAQREGRRHHRRARLPARQQQRAVHAACELRDSMGMSRSVRLRMNWHCSAKFCSLPPCHPSAAARRSRLMSAAGLGEPQVHH